MNQSACETSDEWMKPNVKIRQVNELLLRIIRSRTKKYSEEKFLPHGLSWFDCPNNQGTPFRIDRSAGGINRTTEPRKRRFGLDPRTTIWEVISTRNKLSPICTNYYELLEAERINTPMRGEHVLKPFIYIRSRTTHERTDERMYEKYAVNEAER